MFAEEVKPARASFCNPFRHGAICMDLASTVEINPWKEAEGMEFDLVIRGGTVVTAADIE